MREDPNAASAPHANEVLEVSRTIHIGRSYLC